MSMKSFVTFMNLLLNSVSQWKVVKYEERCAKYHATEYNYKRIR